MKTNVPIVLTLSRIAAIPVLIACAMMRTPIGDLIASFTFGAAATTDYIDGLIARSRNQQTEVGRMLDPIADKLIVSAALIMLIAQGTSTLVLYPATLIILREILVSGLREFLASISKRLPSTWLSKWKTGFQMVESC